MKTYPATRRQFIRHLGDLTTACGEKDLRAIPQGKGHVSFAEAGQRPTHVNSIAIGQDGSVYSLVNISGRTDLVRIPLPQP